MTKILLTGGHLTPALATIDYLQKHYHYQFCADVNEIFKQLTGLDRASTLCHLWQKIGLPAVLLKIIW